MCQYAGQNGKSFSFRRDSHNFLLEPAISVFFSLRFCLHFDAAVKKSAKFSNQQLAPWTKATGSTSK